MAIATAALLGTAVGMFQQLQAGNIAQAGANAQAQTIRVGGDIAATGATLTAAGFRSSAESVKQSMVFNLEIDRINLQRKLKAASRQFQRTLGQQLTQQAASGISLTSKSALMIRNETQDVFGRAILNMKVDAENTIKAKQFESEVKQVQLENQARASDFRAEAERVLAGNKAQEVEFAGQIAKFKSTQKLIGGASTLLGQLGGG